MEIIELKRIYGLPITKTEKLVLYTLQEMDAWEEPVSLTYDQMTEYFSIHRKSVKRLMDGLAKQGYITAEAGRGRGTGMYQLVKREDT